MAEILNPLSQFEITDLLALDTPLIGNIHLSITNIGFYLITGLIFILILNLLSTNYNRLVSNNWSISQETLFATIHSIVVNQINPRKGAVWFRKSLSCLKLSNSGNPLKLLVPNGNWNFTRGWANHLCMVTSQKMKETEMGYRGSKSIARLVALATKSVIVKEQRVDGSWHGLFSPCLRCTLMGFERNYQVKILSNQMNKQRFYTISAVQPEIIKLDPWFVTGFTDGEGCFQLTITRNKNSKIGWHVELCFEIATHEKDKALLEKIQNYLNVGNISKHGSQTFHYRVRSTKDLAKVIDHFDLYPLITQKLADYKLFKEAYDLIINQEHLTLQSLSKLVAIKGSMNLGLSSELKTAFPGIAPVTRPLIKNQKISDPNWLAGFTSAEGCFFINFVKSASHKLKERVRLIFILTQHSRDEQLIRNLIEYFDCGNVYKDNNVHRYRVEIFSDIKNKIIPLFEKYPIEGIKSKDFADFCKVTEMMKDKKHLTKEGLEQIREIKAGMNRGRVY